MKSIFVKSKSHFFIIIIALLSITFFFPIIFKFETFFAFDTLLDFLPWSYFFPEFQAHNPLITDPVNIFYPYYHFFKESINEYRLNFWMPYNFGGIPYTPPTYPFSFILYSLLPQTTAHDLILWIHLLGTGLFMFLYLKEIGLLGYSSLIGAVSWMFNGYIMVWFEFENVILLSASFPATLFFLERWFRTKEIRHFFYMIVAISFSVSTAFAHLLIFQFIFLFIYCLYRYINLPDRLELIKVFRKNLLYIVAFFILLLAVSSSFIVQHLSFLEEEAYHRTGYTFEELYRETGKLPSKYLITLVFPDFFGSPAGNQIYFIPHDNNQPYNNYNELCIYPGIITFFLALTCIPFLGNKANIRFYFITALICLTMAMGSILFYPLAKYVPGLNLSTPTRILYLFGFCIAILSAEGVECLIKRNQIANNYRIILIIWSIIAISSIFISLFVQTEAGIKWAAGSITEQTNWNQIYLSIKEHLDLSSPAILKPLTLLLLSFSILSLLLYSKKISVKNISLIAILSILSYDLISFGLFYNTTSPKSLAYPETEAIKFLKRDNTKFRIMTFGNFMHNSFLPFGIEDAGGYSSFYPKRYGEYLHAAQFKDDSSLPQDFSRWITFQSFGSPLLDLINVKYILLPPSISANSEQLKLVYDKEIKIYENMNCLPRIFFVPEYQYCNSSAEAYNAIKSYSTDDFKNRVILESKPRENIKMNSNGSTELSSIIKIKYEYDQISIEARVNQDGFIVISDNYDAQWQASIDGKKTSLYRANYIMRSIPIKTGKHSIIMEYYPSRIISATIVTIISWTILLGIMFIFFYRR